MKLRLSKPVSNGNIFVLAVLLGIVFVVASAAYAKWTRVPLVAVSNLAPGIAVAAQIGPATLAQIKAQGFAAVIDIRPDGEAADQPPSTAIEAAARAEQISFTYVPVPRGDIPDSAVAALDKALATSTKPILLYCRIGRRAARTWSLVEASRSGGMDAAAILAAVKSTGFSADDLSGAIARRIANRSRATGVTQ